METDQEKKAWTVVKRAQSFTHALRGVKIFLKTTPNALIELVISLFGIGLGIYFCITPMEWIALIFAIALTIVAEAINTAIEIDINLTSPEYHPYARDTKDVAAGAVLLASTFSLAIGLIIFIPKIFNL